MSRSRRNQQYSDSLDNQQQQHKLGSRRKNNTNAENKIFACPSPCTKIYGSVAAWYTHFNNKHRKGDPNEARRIKAEFYRKVHAGNNPQGRQIQEQAHREQLNVADIPTVQQQAQHKINSDKVYLEICTCWRNSRRALELPQISDILYNSQLDLINQDVQNFQDIQRIRKQLLRKSVIDLVEEYNLHDLHVRTEGKDQFRDYKVENVGLIVNFAWDLLIYFKTNFAAKLHLALQSLCFGVEVNENPSWRRFKSREWSKYSFIDTILKKYHEKWLKNNRQLMNFI